MSQRRLAMITDVAMAVFLVSAGFFLGRMTTPKPAEIAIRDTFEKLNQIEEGILGLVSQRCLNINTPQASITVYGGIPNLGVSKVPSPRKKEALAKSDGAESSGTP